MTSFEPLSQNSLVAFIQALRNDPMNYYDIRFAVRTQKSDLELCPKFCEEQGLDMATDSFRVFETTLVEEMLARDLIIKDEAAAACNWRLRILGWFNRLTEEEKLTLPVIKNSVNYRRAVKTIPGMRSIDRAMERHHGARKAMDYVNSELKRLGVIGDTYLTQKEKKRLQKEAAANRPVGRLVELVKLQAMPVKSREDIIEPSAESPFGNLLHLFAIASLTASSDSGMSNHQLSFQWVVAMLIRTGMTGTEPLEQIMDQYLLSRYRNLLQQKILANECSPTSANTLLSALRKAFKAARDIQGLEHIRYVDVQGFSPDRTSDNFRPYSKSERTRIAESIDADILFAERLMRPYVMSGVGEDPLTPEGTIKNGWGKIPNAQWIFENRLGCRVVTAAELTPDSHYERAFLKIMGQSKDGLRGTLESWGVMWRVDTSILAPFVIKLAQVTGLNADSVKTLDLDDFVKSHPATGRPCLRYWKERSTGEKLYHLDLFHAEITWLTTSQASEVSKIFDAVDRLTAGIREQADPEINPKLFIFQGTGGLGHGEIKSLESAKSAILNNVFAAYTTRKGLVDDEGNRLSITSARLRPSFVSELIEAGVSIREIQLILGHSQITTTIGYLDSLDFNHIARRKLDLALKDLHNDAMESKLTEAELEEQRRRIRPQPKNENIIFKTPLASCSNVLDPPDFIKKLSSYVPGRPCSLYNMCLGCDNVLLTVSNLPELFSMQRDYLKIVTVSRIMDTPYGRVVRENLALLDDILNPGRSDFTPEELENGKRLSEFVESTILVDGVSL
ncbi:site-specific integrase [Pseudomonas sp. MIL9]|uniref:site-specific integrase n=1 Tax=Pseudomonas sp. MIL9 TaxID=2807620 RepID=UPI0019522CC5|nr:site-specific integrase [Pseudomonas sp. MIL9]MBM6444441.1 site-specific integrase [Pseudomonas sp. MIL9]